MERSDDRDGGRRQSVWTTLPAILTGVAAIVTAVAGLVAVFAGSNNDPPQPTPTAVGTQVVLGLTATATATPERSATPDRTATPVKTPKLARGDTWPPSRNAYTVILASKTTRSEAQSVAEDARGDLPEVGVLHSTEHPGLNPGYWVAYSGAFESRAPANQNAADAKSIGFSSAYPRYIQGR